MFVIFSHICKYMYVLLIHHNLKSSILCNIVKVTIFVIDCAHVEFFQKNKLTCTCNCCFFVGCDKKLNYSGFLHFKK